MDRPWNISSCSAKLQRKAKPVSWRYVQKFVRIAGDRVRARARQPDVDGDGGDRQIRVKQLKRQHIYTLAKRPVDAGPCKGDQVKAHRLLPQQNEPVGVISHSAVVGGL